MGISRTKLVDVSPHEEEVTYDHQPRLNIANGALEYSLIRNR